MQSEIAVEKYNQASTPARDRAGQDRREPAPARDARARTSSRPTTSSCSAPQSIYKSRDVGVVDVIFQADSFDELITPDGHDGAARQQRRRHRPRHRRLQARHQGPPHQARRRTRSPPPGSSPSASSTRTSSSPSQADLERPHRQDQEADQEAQVPGASCARSWRSRATPAPSPARSTPTAPGTRRSSPSRSGTSACPTCGAAPARAASTAPASPCTATRRSASACRTAPPTSSAPASRSPSPTCAPATSSSSATRASATTWPSSSSGTTCIEAPHTGDVVRYGTFTGRDAWIGGRF